MNAKVYFFSNLISICTHTSNIHIIAPLPHIFTACKPLTQNQSSMTIQRHRKCINVFFFLQRRLIKCYNMKLLSHCEVWNVNRLIQCVSCILCFSVCKFKAHKRCAVRATNNCKWTTLASIGKDIIEDEDGVSVCVKNELDIPSGAAHCGKTVFRLCLVLSPMMV